MHLEYFVSVKKFLKEIFTVRDEAVKVLYVRLSSRVTPLNRNQVILSCLGREARKPDRGKEEKEKEKMMKGMRK